MNHFTPLLKKIHDNLDLPQPTKSRIILEIAADLDDLYHVYLDQGLGEKEALKKAQEKFDLTEDALQDLVHIHETIFRKWIHRISEHTQSRWERLILLIVLWFIALFSSRAIWSTEFIINANRFVWPVLCIAFIITALSLYKIYLLYIKKDHNFVRIRKGMPIFLFSGGLNLFIGLIGYFSELYSAGTNNMLNVSNLIFLNYSGRSGLDYSTHDQVMWMIRSSSMIMVCLLVTIFIAIMWFVLENKIVRIEQAEAECLLKI